MAVVTLNRYARLTLRSEQADTATLPVLIGAILNLQSPYPSKACTKSLLEPDMEKPRVKTLVQLFESMGQVKPHKPAALARKVADATHAFTTRKGVRNLLQKFENTRPDRKPTPPSVSTITKGTKGALSCPDTRPTPSITKEKKSALSCPEVVKPPNTGVDRSRLESYVLDSWSDAGLQRKAKPFTEGNYKTSESDWSIPKELINLKLISCDGTTSIGRTEHKVTKAPWDIQRICVTDVDCRMIVNLLACVKVHALMNELWKAQKCPSPERHRLWAADFQKNSMCVYLATEVGNRKDCFGQKTEEVLKEALEVIHGDYSTGVAAPELMSGNVCDDRRSLDSWALGALIYGWLTGAKHFGEEPINATIKIINARGSPTADDFAEIFLEGEEGSLKCASKLRHTLKLLFTNVKVVKNSNEVDLPFGCESKSPVQKRLHSVVKNLLAYNPKERCTVEDTLKALIADGQDFSNSNEIQTEALFEELVNHLHEDLSGEDSVEEVESLEEEVGLWSISECLDSTEFSDGITEKVWSSDIEEVVESPPMQKGAKLDNYYRKYNEDRVKWQDKLTTLMEEPTVELSESHPRAMRSRA